MMSKTQGSALNVVMADHDKGPEYALVACIGNNLTCTATSRVEDTARLSTAQIIAVLAERGWTVRPTLCPQHNTPTTTP